jgi:hypothetical protein
MMARSIVALVLVNLVTLIALQFAYAWHHWLVPKRDRRRARQRSFERLLAGPCTEDRVAEPHAPFGSRRR